MLRTRPTRVVDCLSAGDVYVPIHIHFEYRSSIRFSMSRSKAHFRLPNHISSARAQQEIDRGKEWLFKTLEANPKTALPFKTKVYQSGDSLQVGDRRYYFLVAHLEETETIRGKIRGDQILLQYPKDQDNRKYSGAAKKLISRLVAKEQLPEIKARVHQLNTEYFRQPVHRVSLKYNQTNWGSCSSKGNINLSTRLLFAPTDVIDYVIIHELAHRIEMNHSVAFYQLIAGIMPDFRQKEKWLKDFGGQCDF